MADWNALRDYIKGKYPVGENDEADLVIKLRFAFEDGRSQMVFVVNNGEYGGTEWASIGTVVCSETELTPRDALARGHDLVFGGFVLIGDKIVFQHSFPLRDLQASEFDVPLGFVAAYGDALEQELTGKDEH